MFVSCFRNFNDQSVDRLIIKNYKIKLTVILVFMIQINAFLFNFMYSVVKNVLTLGRVENNGTLLLRDAKGTGRRIVIMTPDFPSCLTARPVAHVRLHKSGHSRSDSKSHLAGLLVG